MTTIGCLGRESAVRKAACCLLVGLLARVGLAAPEFRGVWADAFHAGFKSTGDIDDMVQRAVTGNYNAIVAEVLAFEDNVGSGHGAYWNSGIVPKATDISGGIDPLRYLCQQAHAAGLEVHAWIATYRVSSSWPPSGNATLTAHPEWLSVPMGSMGSIAKLGSYYCLDPGSPDVQEYLMGIVRELVANYEIDGINWDYIRYTQTDAGYPSDTNYASSGLRRFQRITGYAGTPGTSYGPWNDFRRRTIDELVRRCRAEIAAIKENPRQPLRHTADVFATGDAPANFSSSQAYSYFQNWRLWMEKGWLDAGMPMNYKREHCSSQAQWYRNWIDAALNWRYQRHMYCGQANYLNGMAESVTQLQYARSRGADGTMNYSYYATRALETLCDGNDDWVNDWDWYPHVSTYVFTEAAALPAMPWRHPATATEGTLWGWVIDRNTQANVDDATVRVGSLPSVQTDGNGCYVVTLIPAAASGTNYAVTITKSGLPSASHPAATVLAGDIVRYDFSLGALAPQLGVSPALFEWTIETGQGLPDDTFTVSAVGSPARGPVNYSVREDVNWLSIGPPNGTSRGEQDPITIRYAVTGLPAGLHQAPVTVSDAAAVNNPQTVTVRVDVRLPPVPGDFDQDDDVDLADFGHMQTCLSGPSVPQNNEDCQSAKFDGDSDVDQDDLLLFLGCVTGERVFGDPNCLDR